MRRALLAVTVASTLGLATLTACSGGSSPPSCARHQNGLSLTAQNKCLDSVGTWCRKNYPNDLACSDRVFGYAPRQAG